MKPKLQIKLQRFGIAFTKEQRDSMSSDVKTVLRNLYNNRHQNYDKTHTFKDFTRTRGWVVLARNRDTGVLRAEVEYSFNMGWSSTEARVYRPSVNYDVNKTRDGKFSKTDYNRACGKYAAGLQKRISEYQEKYPRENVFLARIGSKNCPIKIDWAKFHSIKNKRSSQYRNLAFKLR
ncbi:hypothetical protein NVP1081O_318 [Vibrio phage 1.081.O._10N.286.52.C2]|nr:hypothetical protein NVP1081O_318 [Vibrio phage 1.081.O._10N.286.52.C2]